MTNVVSPPGRISRSSPISVMIPVNISSGSRQDFEHIIAERFDSEPLEARRSRERRHAEGLDGRQRVAAQEARRLKPGEPVDEIGLEERARKARAAFDENAREAALSELGESGGEIELGRGRHWR